MARSDFPSGLLLEKSSWILWKIFGAKVKKYTSQGGTRIVFCIRGQDIK